jgi:hypothetical protein|tara:strand:+ start:740 stop:964 length:225 start_codon:yes stop_codon:yes gene_type:complete
MIIELWIDQLQLEQMASNIKDLGTALEEPFDNLVEYTTMPLLDGQISVSIDYDTYITQQDNGLLLEWTLNENQE